MLSEADFTAEPVERLDAPDPPTPAERRGYALALIGAALLHLLVPLSFFLYYWLWPVKTPTAVEEIPVEVVVEQPPPPKPKPKPPEEKQKPPPPPEVEKPAYDAPAAPTKEKVNRESPDKTTEAKAAPETPPPPNPGAPPKAEEPAPEPKPADQQQKAETTPPAHDLTPSPEGELPADKNPKEEDNPSHAAAPAAPPAEAKAPVGAPVPTIEDLPQYKFARSVEDSPIAGGSAESRYLTIIYGMIKAHLHESPALHIEQANRHGIVDFYVDEGGNLVGRRLIASSGSSNLDIAVMAAIAEAAPYPAPPNWSPVSLNYNFGRSPRSAH